MCVCVGVGGGGYECPESYISMGTCILPVHPYEDTFS